MPRNLRWLLMLCMAALLFAVLEGSLLDPPTWFIQVCGALSIACPSILLAATLTGREHEAQASGEARFNDAGPATPTR